MDMKQSLPGDLIGNESPSDANNHNGNNLLCISDPSDNEQCRSVNASTLKSSNVSAIRLHSPPNSPITVTPNTAPLPPNPILPNTPRSMSSNAARYPLCPHALYVLADNPRRTAVVSKNIECSNCGTKITSAWRRNENGANECNACNLFFRRNGRKRPASMRRDAVVRRYRLSSCSSCMKKAELNATDLAQLPKSVSRRRRSGKACSKYAISQNNNVQPPASIQSQATAAQNFLVPSDASFTQSLPSLVQSKAHYSDQNPAMMSFTTEPTELGAVDTQQQTTPSEVSDELSYTRPPHSAFLEADVFVHHMLNEAPNANACVVKDGPTGKDFSLTDQNTEDHQKQPYGSIVDDSVQHELVEKNIINDNQFEHQHDEAFSISKEEGPSDSFLNRSPSVHNSPSDVDSVSASAFGNTQSEWLGLCEGCGDEECNENTLFF